MYVDTSRLFRWRWSRWIHLLGSYAMFLNLVYRLWRSLGVVMEVCAPLGWHSFPPSGSGSCLYVWTQVIRVNSWECDPYPPPRRPCQKSSLCHRSMWWSCSLASTTVSPRKILYLILWDAWYRIYALHRHVRDRICVLFFGVMLSGYGFHVCDYFMWLPTQQVGVMSHYMFAYVFRCVLSELASFQCSFL